MEPDYLGDGVFAQYDGCQVKLFTHNGLHELDKIYMEPEVVDAFIWYINRLKEGS